MDKATKTKTNYDALAGEVTKYDKLLKESTLGYVKAQIWGEGQLGASWGEINDRELSQVEKKKVKSLKILMGFICQSQKTDMANLFKKNGIQQCRLNTVIKVAMKRTWLVGDGLKEIEGLVIEEIPELDLTEDGKVACALGQVKPMEGLGRRGGIERIYEELTKDLEIARTKKKKIMNMK